MYLRGQCCFTSFRLQGFHTSHLFFFLRGGGRNGKSWLMKTILDVTACGHQPGDSACAREATAFSRIDAPWHWDGAVSGRIGATGIMLSQLDSAGLNIECWTESYRRGAKWSSFFLELPRLDTRNVINPLHEAKLADICPQISSIVPVATWTTRFKWVSSWFGHGSASPVLPSTQVLPKKCRPVQMNRKKWWSRNHRLVKHLRRPKMSLKRQLCLCLLCLLYLLYHWQTWDREKGPALETRKGDKGATMAAMKMSGCKCGCENATTAYMVWAFHCAQFAVCNFVCFMFCFPHFYWTEDLSIKSISLIWWKFKITATWWLIILAQA